MCGYTKIYVPCWERKKNKQKKHETFTNPNFTSFLPLIFQSSILFLQSIVQWLNSLQNKYMIKMNHTQLFFHKHDNNELTLEGEVACNHYKKFMVEWKSLNFEFYFHNLYSHVSNDHKRKHVYCEFYNLFLHESKQWFQTNVKCKIIQFSLILKFPPKKKSILRHLIWFINGFKSVTNVKLVSCHPQMLIEVIGKWIIFLYVIFEYIIHHNK
jgi:hypothetical protein